MPEFDGARPAPGAPKKPGAVSQPPSRPLRRDADGCYPVAMDNMIVPTLYANENNNNQDSAKRPKPQGTNPDSHVNTPQGKPSA